MAKAIEPSGLTVAINDILAEYRDAVVETAGEAVKTALNEARDELRQTSPRGARPAKESYARSWRVKLDRKDGDISGGVVYSVQPQLTHLLEHGHAKVGKSGGRTAAQPHIAPAQEHAAARAEQLIKEGLNR